MSITKGLSTPFWYFEMYQDDLGVWSIEVYSQGEFQDSKFNKKEYTTEEEATKELFAEVHNRIQILKDFENTEWILTEGTN